jgi:similar to stage IV sporulation protein
VLQKLINCLRGSVRLEVSGAFPERFLNLCAQRGVLFWGVEWLDSNTLRLTVTRGGAREAGALAGRVQCEMKRLSGAGIPAFLGRFRRRYALLVGLALSLAAVCVLSRFILTIDVEGNQNVSAVEILTELRRQGLRVGAYGPGLDTVSIANQALLQLPELSWMSVNLHGTRAEVLVREAIPKPELVDDQTPGNVVAESGGIITGMDVLAGEPVFQEGDTVAAGEVIISGNIKIEGPEYGGGVDLGWSQVRAAGRVYARTWRTMTAQIPLQAQVKQYTGEEESRYVLTILGQRVKFFGKSGISFPEYDKISETWTATLPDGREMPLAISRETVRAYTTVSVSVNQEQAQHLLEEQLERALERALGDGEVLSTQFSAAQQDGMLQVTLRAECKEEIGKFVPLAGGGEQEAPSQSENK